MHQFKQRVLESALIEINEKTDLNIRYEQIKSGRNISGFSFKVTKKQKQIKSERDPNTLDIFAKLTDAQRHMFANKLSGLPEMSKYSQGTESFQQFAIRIAEMLLDETKFKEFYPLLVKCGFQPN
jgi:plasmid replication initiation protein